MARATPHETPAPAKPLAAGPAGAKGPASRLRRATGHALARGQSWYAHWRTPAEPLESVRLEAAVQCRRPRAFSLAFLFFVAGMTLDDLRVLRWPAYAVGAALAILAIAVGPLTMGRQLAATHRLESLAEFQARLSRLRRLDLLALLVVVLGCAAWLAVFSAGVPPWAR